MEKTIWKYELGFLDKQTILMPKGAELLSVQAQNGVPCLWALVDPIKYKEERTFELFGTGQQIVYSGNYRGFIGTFHFPEKGLVFHLFETI